MAATTEVITVESNMSEIYPICVYQTEGMLIKDVYEAIRKKLEANQFPNQPWVPVSGIGKGAIKIENKKIGIENKYIS